jgi:hypothetical protein
MLVLHPQNIGAARMKAKVGAAMIDASQEASRPRTPVCACGGTISPKTYAYGRLKKLFVEITENKINTILT